MKVVYLANPTPPLHHWSHCDSDDGCGMFLCNISTHLPDYTVVQHRRPQYKYLVLWKPGARGGIVVKALCYKLAGHGFDSRWCHWIFQWHNPSGRTVALGSTQPLAEMSTRCISWGKGGLCIRLTTLPTSCATVMKSGNLKFLEPSGPLQAFNGTAFFTMKTSNFILSVYISLL